MQVRVETCMGPPAFGLGAEALCIRVRTRQARICDALASERVVRCRDNAGATGVESLRFSFSIEPIIVLVACELRLSRFVFGNWRLAGLSVVAGLEVVDADD